MMDSLSALERSERMSLIRGKDTKPEVSLRQVLHREGLRFRLHVRSLSGCPDIVFPRYRVVIFVHGCFWHHHHGCKIAHIPKTHPQFWEKKFKRNVDRDIEVTKELKSMGWKVIVVWECEINTTAKIISRGKALANEIRESK